MNVINYKEALNAKVHYITKLYEKINSNTVMIVTSDSSNKTFSFYILFEFKYLKKHQK